MTQPIEIVAGDITTLAVDAIVNAAKASLLGGGGVDGAIHRAAGPKLREACRALGGCAVGEAKITPGFELPATYVIHTVGPVWRGGAENEDELLARCYRNCLALAEDHELARIAFPAISTGAYGFPLPRAAHIAIGETLGFLREHEQPERVIFVCFDDQALACYRSVATDFVA